MSVCVICIYPTFKFLFYFTIFKSLCLRPHPLVCQKHMLVLDRMTHNEIKIVEGLNDGRERGRGCFGAVYEVRVNGLPCIAKRLHDILVGRGGQEPVGREQRGGVIGYFRRECDLHGSLRHPNVVQFMGVHYGLRQTSVSSWNTCIWICNTAWRHTPTSLSLTRPVSLGM